MDAPRFGHLAYSKTEPPRHELSLAESGIAPPDLAELGLPTTAPVMWDAPAVLTPLENALGARNHAPGGRVILTAGASEAIAISLIALAGENGEALVESFGYEPHRETPRKLHIPTRTFKRDTSGAPGIAATIEAQLSPRTRVVLVSELHNPTGASLPESDLEALTRLAERRGIWLLCDETFRDAAERPLGTLASRSNRWVTISTLTKVYGMGGLRVGWIAGGEEALALCADAQHALSVNVSHPAASFATALLPHLDSLRARAHGILRENHARWREFASAHPEANAKPAGTTTWLSFGVEGAGDAFTAFASERFDLAITPGRFFGDASGARIGLGGDPGRFAAALERLEQAMQAFDRSALSLKEKS
jgi:aspartate/methionine/tyrosine aminotransferase